MDLCMFEIGGWNQAQPIAKKSLEKFVDESMPWFV